MNERIRKLAVEAGLSIRGHYDESGSTPAELQKFAELIVKECLAINTRRLFSNTLGDHLGNAHNNAIWCCNADMQKHFGVSDER
jgi:hypothetical protein